MSYISQIKLPNNTTYDINSKTVNGHTVASDVPSNAVFTDTNNAVTQTSSTTNSNFEILLSGTADDVTRTEGANKSQYALFNPNKKAFTFGTRAANSSIGEYSTSEGSGNTASGAYSHVEGLQTSATYSSAHAEGAYTSASGGYAHAEGYHTTASVYAHAEGNYTTASGYHSHAEGYYTTATHKSQHVFGEYNVLDTSSADSDERGTYVEIVGKGTADNARSNARTLDWSGNEVLAGGLTIGSASDISIATGGTWDGTNTSLKTALAAKKDEKVKQQNYTTYSGEYRLLLSGTNDDTERTECVGKSSHLTYNPWTDEFSISNNATLGVFGSSGVGGLLVRHYDIQFNNSDTWDGTHDSLKDTITYLSSQSAANKVSKTGDTMSGVLTTTYKSTTYVNSLTSSAITLTDEAGTFGGWICGPTKDGRITIATYQNGNNVLYFGYGERGRTDNSYARQMTWDGSTGDLAVTQLISSTNVKANNGKLISTQNGNTVTIGSDNTSWCHIYNSANIPFIFNKGVCTTAGDLGTDAYRWGTIYMKGDFNLKNGTSDDSPDIVWYYGNGREKCRLWTDNTYSAAAGINYRVYNSSGTQLYTGKLALANHSHTLGTTAIQVKYRDYKPTSSGTSLGIAINTLPSGYVFVCWVGFQSVGGTIGHPEWDHSASSTTAYFPQGYVANVTERFFYLIAKSTI